MHHIDVRIGSWLLLLALFISTQALAAPQMTIESRIEERQVVVVAGREEVRYVPTSATTPGSILRFTLAYRNSGDEPATDVILDNPIPPGTTYLGGSASAIDGGQTEFSVDGGINFRDPTLLTTEITLPNGKRETRRATPEQYTHIRWRLPNVPAGTSGTVSFEAQVK